LDYTIKIGLFEETSIDESWEVTGKAPVDTKWVDVNKGSAEAPDIRCRLVARDFKPKGERDRCDLFAAMPPLEANKLMFRMAAGGRKVWRDCEWRNKKLMFIDIKKAHLNGHLEEDERAYVSMPEGCCKPGRCGRLKRWLYGMRPAAHAWEKDYTSKFKILGLVAGISAPTVFHDPLRDVQCLVHGDDFTFLGWGKDLKDIEEGLKEFYELKVRGFWVGWWGTRRRSPS
jgi:hypothetical protein